jgi:transposase
MGPYRSAVYHRLAVRRGTQRAMLAEAHAIVVSACQMLFRNTSYRELGAHSCDAHRRHHLVDRLARRIERLGDQLSLQPVTAAESLIFSIVELSSNLARSM